MEKICIRYLITGRVQGVYYRDATRRQAEQLQITGWTRNLSDGRVEVMAQGTLENLEKFQQWLWKGPVLAKVTEVIVEPTTLTEHFTGFTVR
ncbi:MAG: acylphosphatase [Gammaproteobacteria bacterium]